MKTEQSVIMPQLPKDDLTRTQFDKGMQQVVSDLHRKVRTDLNRMAFTGGKRQAILSCAMDSTDTHRANFLTAGTTSIDLDTSVAPLVLSFADGTDENGFVDHIVQINNSKPALWSGVFERRKPRYLYFERDSKGGITSGSTIIQPRYGGRFIPAHALLHFESSVTTDEWGNTWTANGNAQLSGTQYKFGTQSMYLDGTGDYLYSGTSYSTPSASNSIYAAGPRFTLEGWFYADSGAFSAARSLFSGGPYCFNLRVNTSSKLTLYVSNNGVSWNIVNAVTESGTTSTQTWYHIALEMQWLEEAGLYRYVVYKDGTAVITSSVSDTVGVLPYQIRIGGSSAATPAESWKGYVDEVRLTLNACRYGNDFTKPSAAFEKYEGDLHWFDTATGKMKVLESGGWVEKLRLFTGASYQKDDADEIDSVRSFQPNGIYHDMQFEMALTARYIDWGLGMSAEDGISSVGGYYSAGCAIVTPIVPVSYDTATIYHTRWDSFRGICYPSTLYAPTSAYQFMRVW